MDLLTQEQQSLLAERIQSIKSSNKKLDSLIQTAYKDQNKALPYSPILLRIYPQQYLTTQTSALSKIIQQSRNSYCQKWNSNPINLEKCYKFYHDNCGLGTAFFRRIYKYKYSKPSSDDEDD